MYERTNKQPEPGGLCVSFRELVTCLPSSKVSLSGQRDKTPEAIRGALQMVKKDKSNTESRERSGSVQRRDVSSEETHLLFGSHGRRTMTSASSNKQTNIQTPIMSPEIQAEEPEAAVTTFSL